MIEGRGCLREVNLLRIRTALQTINLSQNSFAQSYS